MSPTALSCADFEVLLADFIDGTLPDDRLAAFNAHRESCAACAELAADAAFTVAFIAHVEPVEPPPALLTRLSFEIPSVAPRPTGWRASLFGWLGPVLQPRFAMGMAMTVLSFSMLARFAGIDVRQLKASDLQPAAVWSAIDNRAHRTWDQMVKYYENLRLVYEVQSRLQEWSAEDEQEAKPDQSQNNRKGSASK